VKYIKILYSIEKPSEAVELLHADKEALRLKYFSFRGNELSQNILVL